MKLRFLTMLYICFLSVTAAAVDNSDLAMDTMRDLQRGVRNGYMNYLSPQKQQRFMKLLSEASDVLYRSSNKASYSCVNQGDGWYAVVNLDTNQKLGENISGLIGCQKVLPPVDRDYACVNKGDGWYAVYDMIQLRKLGENIAGFSECTKIVPENGVKFACINQGNGWYAITNLETGSKLGANISGFSACEHELPSNAL